MIGTAKDLVEATAKVVLHARGETVASREQYQRVVNRAHAALERQPGPELAADLTISAIATATKQIATQLRELRNRYGSGHGRAIAPEVAEELVLVSADAAMLWCRWALRRLEHLIAGAPSTLAHDLDGAIFHTGELAARLAAANLPELDLPEQHLLGVAVAHRAMRDTGVVMREGVEACATTPGTNTWPAGYRAGLVDGLFLDPGGYIDANSWGIQQAAVVLASQPDADAVMQELSEKIRQASWSHRFASNADTRRAAIRTMREMMAVLPTDPSRQKWREIADRLSAAIVDEVL
jgi:Abortive infection C-terminus